MLKPYPSVSSNLPRTKRTLNVRLLIGTVVAVSLLSFGLYAWHQHQLKGLRIGFLDRAKKAESEGRTDQAADYLFRYLQLSDNPRERADLLEQIARTKESGANSHQDKLAAIKWYYRAVGAAPDRIDLHARLAKLLLDTGQFALAEEQAASGLAIAPNDLATRRVRALARFALLRRGRPIPATELIDELVRLHQSLPTDVEIATTLARLYRMHPPTHDSVPGESADRVIDKLVAANEETAKPSHEPYLARYLYRVEYTLPGADADIDRAVELAPDDPTVLLTAARAAARRKDYSQALERFRRLAEIEPSNAKAHLGIGQNLFHLGKTEQAIVAWQAGLRQSDPADLAINVRLADTLLGVNRIAEAEAVLEVIDNAIERLSSTGREYLRDWAVASRSLLHAKRDIAKKDYLSAITELRRVAATAKSQLETSDGATISFQALILLGRTHDMLEQFEEAAISYDRALELFPASMETRLAAARAWANAGRLDKAISLSEQSVYRDNALGNTWVLLARLHMQAQLRLPPNERSWETTERVLTEAENRLPDSWQLPLLRVNFIFARDPNASLGEVMQILMEAEQRHGTNPDFLESLARLYQAIQQSAEADRVLEQLSQLPNTSLRTALLRADILSMRQQFAEARKILDSLRPTEKDQRLVAAARLRIAQRQGDIETIKQDLRNNLANDPQNTHLLSQLADLALQQNQWSELDQIIQQLKQAEGPQGVFWKYFEARRLLASKPHHADLRQAEALLGEIDRLRPWWPGAVLLKGLIAEARGDTAGAVHAYKMTLRQGIQTPDVYQRLLTLLHSEGRITEAEQFARMMQQRYPIVQTVAGSNLGSEEKTGQLRLAMQIAQAAVDQDPHDVSARRWLARLQMLSDRFEDAEQQLLAITKEAPDDIQSWSQLFTFYWKTNRPSSAMDVLDQLAEAPIDDNRKHFVLAQAYQLLGKGTRAEAYYQQALELDPDNVPVLLHYASFLQSFDPVRAEQYVRQVLKIDPDHTAARRMLALLLGSRIDLTAQQEATRLIDSNLQQDETSDADQRLKAVLLLRQSTDESRQEAENILRQLIDNPKGKATANDIVLLVSVLESRGEVDQAADVFRKLTSAEPIASSHLAAYVAFLLRTDRFTEADRWLNRLEQQAPSSFLTVQLRCHFLTSTGRTDLAAQRLEDFANDHLQHLTSNDAVKQFLLQITRLCEQLGQTEAAEKWYRRMVERFPESEPEFAVFLAQRRQSSLAIDLCFRAIRQDLSPEMATALLKVMILKPVAEPTVDRDVEKILDQAVERFSDNADFLFYLANYRLKQERPHEAIDIYRQVVQVDPKHVLAWNNLAALLAETSGQLQEAIRCADRALREAGYAVPTVVDTKAFVLIQEGEYDQAVKLLSDVVRSPNGKDPRFYFHLAIALAKNGHVLNARKSLEFAQQLGLADIFLTNLESQYLQELMAGPAGGSENTGTPKPDDIESNEQK